MKGINDALFTNPFRQDDFFDDFNGIDANNWTDTSGDSGAAPSVVTTGDSALSITTGATQNNEAYYSTKRQWDILSSRPILVEFRASFAEADTNAAALTFGLMSGWAANHLVDTTGALVSSFSGCVFHKLAGTLKWRVTSSVGSTRYGNNETSIAAGQSGYMSFRIEIMPQSSTEALIVYKIDTNGGNDFHVVRDSTTNLPITHTLTYTSFAAAALGFGVKATGSTGTETIVTEMARVSQVK